MKEQDTILLSLALFALLFIGAQGAPPNSVVKVPGFDLGIADLQVSDPEHTAEYLEKKGETVLKNPGSFNQNLAGNWSFEFRDMSSRPLGDLELQLVQNGGVIFGRGMLKQGLKRQLATAEGTMLNVNSVNLNLVSVEDVVLYKLKLDIADGNSTSGSVVLYSPGGGIPVEGTVFGEKTDIRRIS